jgi:uncharacterized protein
MKRSFLILHGLENQRPPEHWQFQLAAGLAAAGEKVHYPGLPDPEAPRYPVWEAVLHELLERMEGERIVVCHSLACLLWLRAAAGIFQHERPDRVALVSPPASKLVPESGAGFRLESLDVEAVRASVRTELVMVCSDDDPFNPNGGACTMYAEQLGLEPVVLPGAGHITPDSGYGPWKSIAQWCLDPAAEIVAAG